MPGCNIAAMARGPSHRMLTSISCAAGCLPNRKAQSQGGTRQHAAQPNTALQHPSDNSSRRHTLSHSLRSSPRPIPWRGPPPDGLCAASSSRDFGDSDTSSAELGNQSPDSLLSTLQKPTDASTSGGDSQKDPASPFKTTGLRRTPLSGGVKNATARYDLPSPAVAVRNLVEQAQFAHLCTVMSNMHHRRAGYPFGTLVDFASDGAGFPIFCLSPLAIHTRNILEDSRCSLVVQMPGWTGLANARVTIFGDVFQLPVDMQDAAREIFLQKQEKKDRWVSGNFMFFRMHRISDIYFVGGFGTVSWIDTAEYASVKPDNIVMHQPHETLQVLNETFSVDLRKLLSKPDHPADDAAFISIDRLGADIRVRSGTDYSVERIGFLMDDGVHTLQDAIEALSQLLRDEKPRHRRVALT